jgi:hypothetical protein
MPSHCSNARATASFIRRLVLFFTLAVIVLFSAPGFFPCATIRFLAVETLGIHKEIFDVERKRTHAKNKERTMHTGQWYLTCA